MLSASVTLLALVATAVAMLSRVSGKKTKPPVLTTQVPPPAEIHLSGKIRAQTVVGVAPPVEGTVGALFATFALYGAVAIWRQWHTRVAAWLLGFAIAYAITMAVFAFTSYRRARRVR